MKLIVATKNKGKLAEIKRMLSDIDLQVVSFEEEHFSDVLEDGKTFLENARKKALACHKPDAWSLADDSGLCVDALDLAPGVYSARYAGERATDSDNNAKLISALDGVPTEKRAASFHCALVLVSPAGNKWEFEGKMEGSVLQEPRGENGFGYDPLFLVKGTDRSAAELSPGEKDAYSHRGRALRKAMQVLVALLSKEG
ncbi:MAG: non-canonical purine NTP pyrophosphatase, RdgB/HAM1 family [Deltaproteobacteria bacterium CG_4_10_14_0_2_um_filter_43_8]|nr:MAG: non-canonical purine NTP pyrophosphatase, RdgB/HAM1 family [Deltaproteobacteria bacterium CG11_big_fil_rev_8_21_14_0_20_42_23]PJA21414.1 MAG: non-canonical purine NTP pyrophosphatase, RdgB/HAM1 family [Deltaproteobacteria bacterium CG_4_10_14_0_2_um_filter_43_8]PJC64696.1 MAG: non-canonical purine NTP pyrophosphatase, RdgB/HAM1 family [Deltaproteobacteria bacterium CG_4_9_14_0_2_um_filter_42_21]